MTPRSRRSTVQPDAFMRLALEEARRGLGRTSPEPLSGAVVVQAGRVVGRGFRQEAAGRHAVLQALEEAGARAKGAALYTLTPPCAATSNAQETSCVRAIAAAGIRRVSCAMEGRSLAPLGRLGVRVETGLLADEARKLNRPYFKFAEEGLPWVTLKAAVTMDGKLATRTGESKWITGPEARERVHRLRNVVDVIMVGANTALADNPKLTTRLPEGGGRNPFRVVVDGKLRVHPRLALFGRALAEGTAVATTASPRTARARALSQRGAQLWHFPRAGKDGQLPLRSLLERLGAEGRRHVLVEGGAELFASFLRERLADELWLFLAPKLMGADGRSWLGGLGVTRMAQAVTLTEVEYAPCGPDMLVRGLLE